MGPSRVRAVVATRSACASEARACGGEGGGRVDGVTTKLHVSRGAGRSGGRSGGVGRAKCRSGRGGCKAGVTGSSLQSTVGSVSAPASPRSGHGCAQFGSGPKAVVEAAVVSR